MKTKKIQKKRDSDDKVSEIEEIRKELSKVNKVLPNILCGVWNSVFRFATLRLLAKGHRI